MNDTPVMMDEDFQVPNLRFAWDRDLRPLVNQLSLRTGKSPSSIGKPAITSYKWVIFSHFMPSCPAWWLIPLSKWVITPVVSGLTLLIPFITGVITHLLSGMSHQVAVRAPGKKRPLRATDGARSAPLRALRAGTDSWNASGRGDPVIACKGSLWIVGNVGFTIKIQQEMVIYPLVN